MTSEQWNPYGREAIVPGYMRCVCLDGPRKGREYYFPLGQPEFGINTPMMGDVSKAFDGTLSGYGQYVYKVVAIWGLSLQTRNFGAFYDRTAYKDPQA
jgi:hypothetical protein